MCSCPAVPLKLINMKKRVFENWKTTFIGLALLIGTGIAVATKLATWEQAMLLLPTILGMIWVKDTVLKP